MDINLILKCYLSVKKIMSTSTVPNYKINTMKVVEHTNQFK